jgi:hypothetical protein
VTDDAREDLPAFARAYPADPQLDELVVAFSRGDFRRVRQAAPLLAKESADPSVRAAAVDLRRRIDPAPASLLLIAIGAALLVYLYLHHLSAAY